MAEPAYRNASGLAQAARWALYADALVRAAAVALTLVQGPEQAYFNRFAETFGIILLLINLGSLILFLIWFYRANANVRAMGADGLMGSPGLSVGWFFIPIAFLFMPYVVVRDTWKASAAPRDWQGQPTPPLPGFWWAAFLTTYLVASFSFHLALDRFDDALGAVAMLDLISNGAGVVANLLGAMLVQKIQALQVSPAQLSEHFR